MSVRVWRGTGVRTEMVCGFFFFQAEEGIRDLVRSRGLGDVYKRQQVKCFIKHTCGLGILAVHFIDHDDGFMSHLERFL